MYIEYKRARFIRNEGRRFKSSLKPISRIDMNVVDYICNVSGTDARLTESVLVEAYPHGAIGGYLTNYRNMAFQGRDEAVDFEKATTNLFQDVFGYKAIHLGQTGSKSAPDVLLVSDEDGYQAIIDNKAYSKYSIELSRCATACQGCGCSDSFI